MFGKWHLGRHRQIQSDPARLRRILRLSARGPLLHPATLSGRNAPASLTSASLKRRGPMDLTGREADLFHHMGPAELDYDADNAI